MTAVSLSEPVRADSSRSRITRRDATSVVLASIGVYVASRVVSLLAVFGSTWLETPTRITSLLSSWDGYWYLKIAAHGYPATVAAEDSGNRWAFFPGYPAAIRVVERLTPLSYRDSAILISLVCGALAAAAIGLLFLEFFPTGTSVRATALVVFFPSAFVMGMAYTESMFLLFAAVTLLAIRRKWWIAAAITTNLASLTRSTGILLAVALAAEALRAAPLRDRLRIVGAAALSSIGFVGWCIYCDVRTGHLLAFQSAEQAWGGKGFVWFKTPFASFAHLLTRTSTWHSATEVTAGMALVVVAGGFVCLVLMKHKGQNPPPSWWVYSAGATLTAFSAFWPTSILRYTMVVVPFFGAFAATARRVLYEVVLASFALFQGVFAIVVFVSAVNGHAATAP